MPRASSVRYLTLAERVAYERDIEAFTRTRREPRRANSDVDWVTCVRTIACMPGGSDMLATMRRAAALAAFPEAERRSVHALLALHRGDRTLPSRQLPSTPARSRHAPVARARDEVWVRAVLGERDAACRTF
jgi:hypothetical protein